MPARKKSRSSTASSGTARRRTQTKGKTRTSAKRPGRTGRQQRGADANGTGLTWGDESAPGPKVAMQTVTPNLVPTDCAAALDWYAKVFGAKELARMPGPGDRIMHAMTQIGDTVLMLSDNFGPPIEPQATACAFLHVHDK